MKASFCKLCNPDILREYRDILEHSRILFKHLSILLYISCIGLSKATGER